MESLIKFILILACACIVVAIGSFFLVDEPADPVIVRSDTIVMVHIETVYVEKKAPKAKKKQPIVKEEVVVEKSEEVTTPSKQRVKGRQYIEVKGPLGDVELYNGMPKEEVRELLGKPDNTSMMEIIGDIHETWRYNKKGLLLVEFENGKLTSVMSY